MKPELHVSPCVGTAVAHNRRPNRADVTGSDVSLSSGDLQACTLIVDCTVLAGLVVLGAWLPMVMPTASSPGTW
jgi:hypothetical protein